MDPDQPNQQQPISPATPPIPPTYPNTAPQKKKRPIVKIIAGIVGIFLLAIIGLVAWGMQSLGEIDTVSNKAMSALQNKDASALSSMSSSSFKSATSEADLKTMVDTAAPYLQGKAETVGKKVETKNGTSHGVTVFKVNDYYVRFVFKKEDSSWKLLNFRTSKTELEAVVE